MVSALLFLFGAFVLFGVVDVHPVFGMTSDEVAIVFGSAIWSAAFFAWIVEHPTDGDEQ